MRIYPGGRKAATALHSVWRLPTVVFSTGTGIPSSSFQPTGILPGMLKSWLPFGRGISSEGFSGTMFPPDRPASFREGWSRILPSEVEKTSRGYFDAIKNQSAGTPPQARPPQLTRDKQDDETASRSSRSEAQDGYLLSPFDFLNELFTFFFFRAAFRRLVLFLFFMVHLLWIYDG